MKNKQFAVIGAGRFGRSVARTLYRMNYDVLLIDFDENRIHEAVDDATQAIQADATDSEVLKDLGIRNFDTVIVAIGTELQASVLSTVIMKELGVKTIVAKAVNELHGKVLAKVGADRVVFPERDMGVRVAHQLVSTSILDHIELSPEYSILEVAIPPDMENKTLRKLDFRARFGANIIAIRRNKAVVISPSPDESLQAGDIIVMLGEVDRLIHFERSLDSQ